MKKPLSKKPASNSNSKLNHLWLGIGLCIVILLFTFAVVRGQNASNVITDNGEVQIAETYVGEPSGLCGDACKNSCNSSNNVCISTCNNNLSSCVKLRDNALNSCNSAVDLNYNNCIWRCNNSVCGAGKNIQECTSCKNDCSGKRDQDKTICTSNYSKGNESCIWGRNECLSQCDSSNKACTSSCRACSFWGDKVCNNGETCSSCASDCGGCKNPTPTKAPAPTSAPVVTCSYNKCIGTSCQTQQNQPKCSDGTCSCYRNECADGSTCNSGATLQKCSRCSKLYDNMWTSWQAYDCNKDPDVSTAVTRTYQESCNYKAANTCNRCSTVTPNQYVWWTLESGKTCDQSPDSTKTTIYRASVSSSVCP